MENPLSKSIAKQNANLQATYVRAGNKLESYSQKRAANMKEYSINNSRHFGLANSVDSFIIGHVDNQDPVIKPYGVWEDNLFEMKDDVSRQVNQTLDFIENLTNIFRIIHWCLVCD